jgi:DeoR/GlpR family transcriptional regulator of sugar metabolism
VATSSPNGPEIANLTPIERMKHILQLLESQEAVSVQELAERFAVSVVTVRNDLSELARQGLVARVRGGARTLQRGQSELAFDIRLRLQSAEKRAIARAAAAMVEDGDAIALDCSTSAYYLAVELRSRNELVVVTNGLLIAEALADAPGISVMLIGGMLRSASMSTVGDLAAETLRNTHINKGFLGVRGASVERGLMDLNPDEVRLKRELAAACEQVIGIFDHSKWARSALLSFTPPERVTAIVTDSDAPADLVEAWRARGVDVVIADAERSAPPGPDRPRGLRGPTPQDRLVDQSSVNGDRL